MDYILRDIGIELWSKVKAKATLEGLKTGWRKEGTGVNLSAD